MAGEEVSGERELSRIEVPVCAPFRRKTGITPIAFSPAETLACKSEEVRRLAGVSGTVLRPARGKAPSTSGLRVAAFFSGGPAAAGHNVLVGLQHALGPHNTLVGVRGGPGGLLRGDLVHLPPLDRYLNTGGFTLLGTDRTKLRTAEQFATVREVCRKHKLDAIVVIGGDDSNSNAAFMAQALLDDGITVVGVPKTMDGDLQAGRLLPVPFGFDTACGVYAEMVGNLCRDAASSRKYWHVVRLMGREASHVTLEVALRTRPADALISEEVAAHRRSLHAIIEELAHVVRKRAAAGKNHGVILVPEGLLEAIPEFHTMLAELERIAEEYHVQLHRRNLLRRRWFLARKLSRANAKLFRSLPVDVQDMLALNRDAHGNLKVSQIPTERLLLGMLTARLHELDRSLAPEFVTHFFGYEGRCAVPSAFDAMLGYNLGLCAASLVSGRHTGYLASISDPHDGGVPLGVPLACMVEPEARAGSTTHVIRKTLVRMEDPAFVRFSAGRHEWLLADGNEVLPIQLWGPLSRQLPVTTALNNGWGAKWKVGE